MLFVIQTLPRGLDVKSFKAVGFCAVYACFIAAHLGTILHVLPT